jgi:hypothetical protein
MATKKEKTLLVIGNGFDLAHGLKTKYTDFLDFFNEKFSNIEIAEQSFDIGLINQFRKIIQTSIDSKNDEALYKNLELYMQAPFGNFWIAYFNKILTDRKIRIGEGWVDFEREVKQVISQLEKLLLHSADFDKNDSILKDIMGDYFNKSAEIVTQEFILKLNWDLKVLTLFLEFYLIEEEKKLSVEPKSFFEKLNVHAVISYNYTDTFRTVYKRGKTNIPVHLVHGQLGEHNLVLGIGETLSGKEKNNFTVCASFKKFFQRIKYKLGNDYKNVLPTKLDVHNKCQIVFYGHSLDSTDKRSLKWLLNKAEDFPVKIYYYDDDDYNQKIANAIQIVEKEQLIKDVNAGRIVFLPMDS